MANRPVARFSVLGVHLDRSSLKWTETFFVRRRRILRRTATATLGRWTVHTSAAKLPRRSVAGTSRSSSRNSHRVDTSAQTASRLSGGRRTSSTLLRHQPRASGSVLSPMARTCLGNRLANLSPSRRIVQMNIISLRLNPRAPNALRRLGSQLVPIEIFFNTGGSTATMQLFWVSFTGLITLRHLRKLHCSDH